MPVRRRGAGLVGTAARTAVFAGTMNAVTHKQQKRWASKEQEQAAQQGQQPQQAQPQQAAPPQPPAPGAGSTDLISQLEKLADLKAHGLLNDEEYAAAKARLLG